MKVKYLELTFVLTIVLAMAISCKPKQNDVSTHNPSKQELAEDAIKAWMAESNEYTHYKPVVFGDVTARYERSSRTLQLSIQVAEEEIVFKNTGERGKLDSLRHELEKYKGDLLGYLVPHKFQEQNMAGEVVTKELLFFLDTCFRVASVLTPESFDHIMDEKVFYRLDKKDGGE